MGEIETSPGEHGSVAPSTGRRARGAVREGLISAAVELARHGGPDAVLLREATRRVGVVPNAAYKHFRDRDELLQAVCIEAMRELSAEIELEVDAVAKRHDRRADAVAHLTAVGIGYLRFAEEQPGLFRTAFAVPDHLDYAGPTDDGTPTPLGLLGSALDEMVAAGLLAPAARSDATFAAWSAVHGIAVLRDSGPLRTLDAADAKRAQAAVLAMVAQGLAAG